MLQQIKGLIATIAVAGLIAACSGESPTSASATGGDSPGFRDYTIGSADAPVHIIEYASATCTHCAHFHVETLPTIKQKYVEEGKVRYTFREFPLNPAATLGFIVARCAPENRYMDILNAQFAALLNQTLDGDTVLEAYRNFAAEQGIPEDRLQACLEDRSIIENMKAMLEYGESVHQVTSTPTMIINDETFVGSKSVEEMSAILDGLLGETGVN